jgi:ribosome-binding ATPase YchF (GTP1/OBG family)
MQSASLSYLKHALQPFGSMISLFNLAKAAAEHISLPPVVFQINSLEFADEQQNLMDKVVKVLKERPELKIKACGVSSLEDHEAIKKELMTAEIERIKQQQKEGKKKEDPNKQKEEVVIAEETIQQHMKDLADNRSAKVKNYFLEKGDLKSNRILNCLSSSNIDEKSQASVELEI